MRTQLYSLLSAVSAGALAIAAVSAAEACTSLRYKDTDGNVYHGRTMELTGDLPYQLAYLPAGREFTSEIGDGHPPVRYTSRYSMFGIMMPDAPPDAIEEATLDDLTVVDAVNEVGLSFSLLAYPTAAGPQKQVAMTEAILDSIDLGTWVLAQFETVDEVKAALEEQSVMLAPVRALQGAEPPFHYVLYDRTGASIVIEFEQGQEAIYDNPVGVMTNGPTFDWHLTNLSNYAHLTNVERPTGKFGDFEVAQFDSGSANAGLPSSDTSPDRFVRAAYYSTFAEKAEDPDGAIHTLAQVMNNFDRPRGISLDSTGEGDALTQGLALEGESEYTTWTKLADLENGRFFVRTHQALGYTMFDMKELAGQEAAMVMPLTATDNMGEDG